MEQKDRIAEALRRLPWRSPPEGFRARVMAAVGPATFPLGLPVPAWMPAAALSLICAWSAALLALAGATAARRPQALLELWRDPAAWGSAQRSRLAVAAVELSACLPAGARLLSAARPHVLTLGLQSLFAVALAAAAILSLARPRPGTAARGIR